MNLTTNIRMKLVFIFVLAFISTFYCTKILADDHTNLKVIHEETFIAKKDLNLELYTDKGQIQIEGWDKDEVYVEVLASQSIEKDFKFRFEESKSGFRIEAGIDKPLFWNWFNTVSNCSCEKELVFNLKVPKNFNIKAKTSGDSIILKSITGKMSLKTSGGNVKCDNIDGNLNIQSSGGSVICTNTNGILDVHASGGHVTCYNTSCNLNVETSGGYITVDYTGQNKGINLETSGGSISVKVPSDFNANTHLDTSGGYVNVNFVNSRVQTKEQREYEGKFGYGGKNLECSTSGGNIIISQK